MFRAATQSHHLPPGSDNAGVAGTSHCLHQEWTREPWPHHLLYHCPPPLLTLQCSVSPLLQRVLLQCLETSDAAPHLALRPVTRDNVTHWSGESLLTPGLVQSYSLPLSRHSHLVQIVVGVPWSENVIRKMMIFAIPEYLLNSRLTQTQLILEVVSVGQHKVVITVWSCVALGVGWYQVSCSLVIPQQ